MSQQLHFRESTFQPRHMFTFLGSQIIPFIILFTLYALGRITVNLFIVSELILGSLGFTYFIVMTRKHTRQVMVRLSDRSIEIQSMQAPGGVEQIVKSDVSDIQVMSAPAPRQPEPVLYMVHFKVRGTARRFQTKEKEAAVSFQEDGKRFGYPVTKEVAV